MFGRITYLFCIALLVIGGLTTSTPCWGQSLSSVNRDSIVGIIAIDPGKLENRNGRKSIRTDERQGQGIIIDATGIIATNRHIIGPAPQSIQVRLSDGRKYEATLVQNSPTEDLSLIKINADSTLRAMALADSSLAQIGNRVRALANAGAGLEAPKDGEIIQIYREAASDKIAILEVNIRLKSGDSGGPIFNEEGLLVGLIMANQISDNSKSFAIASNKIRQEYLKLKGSTLISSL